MLNSVWTIVLVHIFSTCQQPDWVILQLSETFRHLYIVQYKVNAEKLTWIIFNLWKRESMVCDQRQWSHNDYSRCELLLWSGWASYTDETIVFSPCPETSCLLSMASGLLMPQSPTQQQLNWEIWFGLDRSCGPETKKAFNYWAHVVSVWLIFIQCVH